MAELLERLDATLESIDAAWCDGVSGDADALQQLSSRMAAVEGLTASSAKADAVSRVSALIDCVDRCGSVVLRSTSLLDSSGESAGARLSALEALRGLSESRPAEIDDAEVRAFGSVKQLLLSLDDSECEQCELYQ